MIDLNTWEALRNAGLEAASAVAAVSEMLATRLSARASARPANR
jgi:hypothetical protein